MYSQIYKIGSEVYNINFDTCHQDILYFLEQKYEDPWLFFEASRGLRAKKVGKHWYRPSEFPYIRELVNTGIDHQRVFLHQRVGKHWYRPSESFRTSESW